MTNSKTRIVLLATLATLVVTSNQAQAQTGPQNTFAALDVRVRPAEAAEMEQRASDLLTTGRGWDEAARLYRDAAELRGAGDLESADNLRLAGYLQFYRGRPKAAVASLMQAGEAFLALGDVERAAGTFIDGAWVAAESGMAMEARELSERGRLLTQSPLLRVEKRTALARRLGGVPGIQ